MDELRERDRAEVAEPDYFGENFLEVAQWLHQEWAKDQEHFGNAVRRLSLSPRLAYYLIEIDRRFGHLAVDKARLRKIGWTKLAIIAKHIDTDNCEQLLAMAEKETAHSLGLHMKNQKPAKLRPILLYLTKAQYTTFKQAILANGATSKGAGFINKEQALVRALEANLATMVSASGSNQPLS